MRQVAVLFARRDSVYKRLAGCDVWDADRDARKFAGGMPVVAHPPCRAWGQLSHFAAPREDEKDLARFAVAMVRRWGGVLEHPARSLLWDDQNLPKGRAQDEHGGWTMRCKQSDWGHRAEKATNLYIVGCLPRDLPPPSLTLGDAPCVVTWGGGVQARRAAQGLSKLVGISKAEREATPPPFAQWLVELARRTSM